MIKKLWPFIILAILAFTLHLAFLSHPSQVVFDEVHFGKFVGAYFTGQYYFDIHPPFGKIIIAAWAKLNNVNPVFSFEKIGEDIPAYTLFVLRFMPAFFGALFVLFFSWFAYLASRSKITALIAGFLILLDNAFLVQSRFILVDIFMLCFTVLTFCFFFLEQRQKSFSLKWFLYLILCGLFFGLSISIKWTAVAAIGIIGVVFFVKIFSRRLHYYLSNRELENPKYFHPDYSIRFYEGLISVLFIGGIGFIIYLIPFAIHFNLLQKSGPGDAFMSQAFQQELKYGRQSLEQPLSFWRKFTELNKTMYTASAGITTKHPSASHWYSWPFDHKPVYYWNRNLTENKTAKIYFLGNPVLWWLALALTLMTLGSFFRKKWRQNISPIFYILTLSYFANLLPFILITRTAFLYHYLPAVAFGILLTSFWLAHLWPKNKKMLVAAFLIIAVVFISFIPVSYGLPLFPFYDGFENNLIQMLTQ